MLMLSLDSSSQAATAAILRDGELLCEYTQNQMKTHSVKMLPMIEQMLKDTGVTFSNIDVYVCGIGPGSFTGVRIGVATVRGFAKTLEKKVVPVNSLEILANNVSCVNGTVFTLLFARENECYCAAFRNGREVISPCVLTVDEIIVHAKEFVSQDADCIFVGDGVLSNLETLKKAIPDIHVASGRFHILSAASAAEVGYRKALNGELFDCEKLIPLYLRKSQAEREYDEKQMHDR